MTHIGRLFAVYSNQPRKISLRWRFLCWRAYASTSTATEVVTLAYQRFYHRAQSSPSSNKSSQTFQAPIIFIHGLLASSNTYRTLLRRDDWAPGREIFAVDLRNHGSSPHHPEMSYEAMIGDMKAFMHEHRIEKACLMGHSMGGKVGMAFALAFPDRVTQLVVVDTAPVSYAPSEQQMYQKLDFNSPEGIVVAMSDVARQSPRFRSRSQVDDALRMHGVTDSRIRQFVLTNLVPDANQSGEYRWRVHVEALRSSIHRLMDVPDIMRSAVHPMDPRPVFADQDVTAHSSSEMRGTLPYEGPCLFVKGSKSPYILEQHLPSLRKWFPAASIQVIEGAGHWLQNEQPDAFVSVVNQFLADKST